MPCHHKFEHYLDLKQINFQPTTLIIGTFNPSWPKENYAEWFYGRTSNNHFWDVLPRIYGDQSLLQCNQSDWKKYCEPKLIAITDLISCIDDADEKNPNHEKLLRGYSDLAIAQTFKNFRTEHIKEIFDKFPSIQNVYFTRSGNGKLWRSLWIDIVDACEKTGKKKPTELLTPSKYARFHFARAKRMKLTQTVKLEDYILERWKEVWHKI